ncbi:hypothetical protein GCM10010121_074840 [Streptomyces brasiliensis]|uniref:DUF6879 domain-containing protein n=1 Tax=Streptomyces brasiliensis TaxID=1954 RepID=A0A917LB02_9ACTN|nr:hypothetical protein GCM10010121_074840 [Streptomyces brasiliensis]
MGSGLPGCHSLWPMTERSVQSWARRIEDALIVDSPPTAGQRYLMVNAERNIELGEDIRNLWRADAEELQLGDVDFWIFDSRLVAQLNFDADDNLVDVELITEPAEVVRYSMLRDAAMHHAIHCERFAALLPAKEE